MAVCAIGPKVMLKKEHFGKHAEPKTVKYEKGTATVAASGFDFPTQLVGTTKYQGRDGLPVTVYYDPATGAAGLAMAQDALARADDLMNYNDQVFNLKAPGGGNIIFANTGGGAYHAGCSFGAGSDWYEDVEGAVSSPGQPAGIGFGLAMAEICESYMGEQNKGIDCGGSGGEAISRVLATIVTGGSNGAMGTSGYAAGPSWDGADWISRDSGTDQDYPSTGCGVLWCWWMFSLGYTIQQIVQAGEPDGTLSSTYAVLTGKPASQAFADFNAAVAAVGGPGSMSGDNPFHAPEQPYPLVVGPTVLTLTASPKSGPVPLSVSFTATGNATATKSLDFGDGTPPGSGVPASHVYSTVGGYTATLTLVDGSTATATVSAGVAPPPPPPPPPGPASFAVQASGTIEGYTFQVPHGLFGTRTITLPSRSVSVTGTATPQASTAHIAWLTVLQDALQLANDVAAKNWPAVFADALQLVSDFVPHQAALKEMVGIAWFQLFRDISKLVTDVKANAGFDVIISDAKAIAADLGIVVP